MRRLPEGGLIDRGRRLRFTWDGNAHEGFAGDTLASALLGAGVSVVGTSVSLGRRRGVMSAGMEEASAFAQIVTGGVCEPLVRITGVALHDGLAAESRIAMGYLEAGPDAGRFDKRYHHCDLLVVGAGPAGLTAALAGARAGRRVVLVESDDRLGGCLLRDDAQVDGAPGTEWVEQARAELHAAPDTVLLTSATASVALDQNGMLVLDRRGARPSLGAREGATEQRLWHIRASAIVLATGAMERPLVFQDNDLPGIMLASGARAYARRFALVPERGMVFTTTDDGYRTALAWHGLGATPVAVVDPRNGLAGPLVRQAESLGIRVIRGAVVERALADDTGQVRAASVRSPSHREEIPTDVLAVSGGFEPSLALHTQRRGSTCFDPAISAPVPERALPGQWIVGSAAGRFALGECLRDGWLAARDALRLPADAPDGGPPRADDLAEAEPSKLWSVPAPDGDESRSFVDLHRDVAVTGVMRATGAGLRHIEHVKRYTLIGTGIEQGRSARLNAGALTAALTDRPPADVGTSGGRPPTEPLVFAALGGRASGPRFDPVRTTALYELHRRLGAVFEPVGQWLRPNHFPRPGESKAGAVARECAAARGGVALMDASTLGKLDVQGPDATWFLERLYINAIGSLPVGRARYSAMCRLDGGLLDDGVVMRLAPEHYVATTSTGHAEAVHGWMEEWLQTEWPEKRVWVTSVTEQFATVVVAGPKSRTVLARVAPSLDLRAEAFPFLGVRQADITGVGRATLARVSFSGELAYELSVAWHAGPPLWEALMAAGAKDGATPYGLETLQTLRTEKGFAIVGQDTEATTTPDDAGLGWLVSGSKDFIGRRSLARAALRASDRLQLVGFVPEDSDAVVPEGAGLVAYAGKPPLPIQGHVTSSYYSHALGKPVGLALVKGGRARLGDALFAHVMTDGAPFASSGPAPHVADDGSPEARRRPSGRERTDEGFAKVRIVRAAHYDPTGARRDG